MYTHNIPNPQNMQKDLKAGMDVVPPMAKARKSVREVIVMETPECFMVSAMLSQIVSSGNSACSHRVRGLSTLKHWRVLMFSSEMLKVSISVRVQLLNHLDYLVTLQRSGVLLYFIKLYVDTKIISRFRVLQFDSIFEQTRCVSSGGKWSRIWSWACIKV